MKRLVCIILCILVFGSLDFAVNAKETFGHHFFEYWVEDGGVQICGYLGKETEVTIPDSISGLPVYAIVNRAFADSTSVQILNIPDTVTEIEEGAISANITVNYLGNIYTNKNDEPAEEEIVTETIEPGLDTTEQENGIADGADDGFEETIIESQEEPVNNDLQEQITEDKQDVVTQTESDGLENTEITDTKKESKNDRQMQITIILCLAVFLLVLLFLKLFKKKECKG